MLRQSPVVQQPHLTPPNKSQLTYQYQQQPMFVNQGVRQSPSTYRASPSQYSSPLGQIPTVLKQSPVQQQSPIVYQQQKSSDVVHLEQPLQLVELSQVEENWRLMVEDLQKQISQLKQNPPSQTKTVYLNDDSKIKEAELELSHAYAQIQQYINTIKILQEEIQKQNDQVNQKQQRIQELENLIRERQQQILEAQDYLADLENQLQDMQDSKYSKIENLQSEVETWKEKFIKLNKEFHVTQEQLMLAQAELDNLKNAKTKVTTSVATSKSNTRKKD